ncbi:MAG: hypothetical protein WDO74_06705 [Pseudomonadota bacterium]
MLLSALPGCGGDADASHIGGAASGNSDGLAGAPPIFVPVGDGGTGSGTGGSGNWSTGGAGPYVLPTDYTKANMGGFKLGPSVDVPTAGAPGVAGAPGAAGAASSGCGTAILGVVRDFKGKNETGGHPDFEAYSGSGASKGIVKATLGMDQKPEYNGTGPIIDAKNGQQTTSKMDFDQWYRATENVNKPYVVYFYFQPNGNVLTFQSTAFFPLDGKGWGNTKGSNHNFGFTTEVHTEFTYKGGEPSRLPATMICGCSSTTSWRLTWAACTRKPPTRSCSIRKLRSSGSASATTTPLDLFHAERHTAESNFRVDTNLAFTNCGTIIEEPPVK